ncbi:MAG: hypothetical protein R3174_05955 [Gammaproteobacteria bacterium]|nr:hypothetical protein [Gammaproteobacteria bacterium]
MSSDEPAHPAAVGEASRKPGTTRESDDSEAAGEALAAWCAVLDEWWREQSGGLPAEIKRPMEAAIGQFTALLALAGAGPAAATPPAEVSSEMSDTGADRILGPWQPVLDALRRCQATIDPDPEALVRNQEYAAAAGAYLGEFARLNLEISRRLREKLAATDSGTGFTGLERLILEQAEEAYLEHVSRDEFARRQAEFINALLRLSSAREPS